MPEQAKPAETAAPSEKDVKSNGAAPETVIGGRDDFLNATKAIKLREEVVEIPELGLSLRCREFTAGQNSTIKQIGLQSAQKETGSAFAEMEIRQFHEAVVAPSFKLEEVRLFHNTWPTEAFMRVVNWVDEVNGNDKEEIRRAREEFQGSDDPAGS